MSDIEEMMAELVKLGAERQGIRHTDWSSSLAAPDCSAKPEIYVFERAEGWYPLELKDDADARRNAELNPGTLKVTTKRGRPVWPNS
jgi:hypothetical protein